MKFNKIGLFIVILCCAQPASAMLSAARQAIFNANLEPLPTAADIARIDAETVQIKEASVAEFVEKQLASPDRKLTAEDMLAIKQIVERNIVLVAQKSGVAVSEGEADAFQCAADIIQQFGSGGMSIEVVTRNILGRNAPAYAMDMKVVDIGLQSDKLPERLFASYMRKQFSADAFIYFDHEFFRDTSVLFQVIRHELQHCLHKHHYNDHLLDVGIHRKMGLREVDRLKHDEACRRCNEREADVRSMIDKDGTLNGYAIKGLLRLMGYFENSTGEEDPTHPSPRERKQAAIDLMRIADGGHISEAALRKFIFNCKDCRRTGSDFFAEARAMMRKIKKK